MMYGFLLYLQLLEANVMLSLFMISLDTPCYFLLNSNQMSLKPLLNSSV
jgi:hypothetical protein